MFTPQFSKWKRWNDRLTLADLKLPGVYALALTNEDISNLDYSLIPEIKYFGMTNAKKGLASRLVQFDNVIHDRKGPGHGGGWRFRFDYPDGKTMLPFLFVSVSPFPCKVDSNHPDDLRIMGQVCEFEYSCIANYVEIFEALPKYNDKKASPKLK